MELKRVLLFVGVTVGIALSETHTAVLAAPPTQAEWGKYQNEIRSAVMQGDYATAAQVASDLHLLCHTCLGDTHPDAIHAAIAVRQYRWLHNSDELTKRYCATSSASRVAAWRKLAEQAKQVLPSLAQTRELLCFFESHLHCIPPTVPREFLIQAECNGGIVRVLTVARTPEAAKPYALSAREDFLLAEGIGIQMMSLELTLAEIRGEIGTDLQDQLALLNGIIEFTERYQTTDRTVWWKERAMTQLAETHYRQGNRQEADRLYAEVRSRLPEDSDHDLVGWCKSWCDRHEARQLMEKGDWDGAYEKIFQARIGTIDYGHRNLSKGLTMERILRMSAEIQRKRGNDKEADEDQEYADRIARHAARLRTAVEAELKKLNES